MDPRVGDAIGAASRIDNTSRQRVSEHESERGPLDERGRLAVWRAHGADEAQAAQLLEYAASPLHHGLPEPRDYPLPDAACVADWARYAAQAGEIGAAAVLRDVLVQLRFPIAAGMSDDPAYQAATRRGILPDARTPGLALSKPEGLRIFLHPTAAGRVPVVLTEAREDFEALLRAITRRNEPSPVPSSMGACLVAGYNNWARVAGMRRAFAEQHPEDHTGQGWAAAFRAIVPEKARYQDRFMLLSAGGYSSTPAGALAVSDEAWQAASIRLRLEHECVHYVTREVVGVMRESLLDELAADYVGMVDALGAFRPDLFLRFMGLEEAPHCRADGRLRNYRGTPPLSDASLAVLASVLVRAARLLGGSTPWEVGDRNTPDMQMTDEARACHAPDATRGDTGLQGARLDAVDKARIVIALLRTGLEGLAADDAPARLASAYDEACACVSSGRQ